jgi:hypothetical protein
MARANDPVSDYAAERCIDTKRSYPVATFFSSTAANTWTTGASGYGTPMTTEIK